MSMRPQNGAPMSKIHLMSLVLLVGLVGVATPGLAHAEDVIDHDSFDQLLGKYVNKRGMVAYKKLAANKDDRRKLDAYLEKISKAEPKGKGRKAKLAFYINAYNAYVIDAVLDNSIPKSVMDVDGFFKKSNHGVEGKELTLDALEKKIIRPQFKDARVHFVLVCAAKSCPRLRKKAMTEKNVNAQLRKAAVELVNRDTKLVDGAVQTSQLFNWFAADFEHDEKSVREYLAKYARDEKLGEALASPEVQIKFADYSWKLNKQ